MARWAHIEENDHSWRFHCSACGNMVYWPQATRGEKSNERICPYPMCPWCGEKMKGAEHERKHD